MHYKVKMASDILVRISVLFILQAIILLMISNSQRLPEVQKENIQNIIPDTPKETPQANTKAKAKTNTKAKPSSKK